MNLGIVHYASNRRGAVVHQDLAIIGGESKCKLSSLAAIVVRVPAALSTQEYGFGKSCVISFISPVVKLHTRMY
jgi:hypothetical protein